MNDIDELLPERPFPHRRVTDQVEGEVHYHYRHEVAIQNLERRASDLETFKTDATPNIEYIKSIIKRNNERAEFYKKTGYNLAGWGIMGIVTWLGVIVTTIVFPAIMTKFKQYLGGL